MTHPKILSLSEIGNKYSLKCGYESFSEYCLLKEKGLKTEAVKSMNIFISSVKKRPLEEQRLIASELAALRFGTGSVDFINQPLKLYLSDIFSSWVSQHNLSAINFRWLGCITGDYLNFEKALEIDKNDQFSILKLAQSHLDDVDYQTHHLGESFLIGDLNTATLSLEKASALIYRLEPIELIEELKKELYYYQELIKEWERYAIEQPTTSFPEWCKLKNKDFRFLQAFYYNEQNK